MEKSETSKRGASGHSAWLRREDCLPDRIGRDWFTLGRVASAGCSQSGSRRAEQAPPLQIREDSYRTQDLSYEIGIRDCGADESA
jgi:hypothetical protein